ncbi:hypothetical protein [Sphingomonas sp. PP-CC-3A-396]|uniref:hypothetical protein n=1 Tax=Sphingomonas sp. PP-CC-3A-396 TaxID=2135655 RepID=UPI0014054790|nr:hypothetical protein [Sphingomonas sp. PP-CC-3A-396]
MRHPSIAVLSFAILTSLGACDRDPKAPPSENGVVKDPVAGDVDRMEAEIRIAAANKRIDELERKVGALEATPEKIDLELLTQRVTALEVKSVSDQATQPQVAPAPRTPASDALRSETGVRRAPTKSPKLTLPELENRPRQASPAEAKAFSSGR